MNEVLTRPEIERQYRDEWILVADPETDEHLNVTRGEVVAHSKDRDEVYQKAVELRLKHSAFLYTGTVPDDVVIIL
ncbi:MAG: hypothetical protein JO250_07425 [Armatimonadetes bacterium]|nr:hypothetical protein [Armatimonadota bacterium]